MRDCRRAGGDDAHGTGDAAVPRQTAVNLPEGKTWSAFYQPVAGSRVETLRTRPDRDSLGPGGGREYGLNVTQLLPRRGRSGDGARARRGRMEEPSLAAGGQAPPSTRRAGHGPESDLNYGHTMGTAERLEASRADAREAISRGMVSRKDPANPRRSADGLAGRTSAMLSSMGLRPARVPRSAAIWMRSVARSPRRRPLSCLEDVGRTVIVEDVPGRRSRRSCTDGGDEDHVPVRTKRARWRRAPRYGSQGPAEIMTEGRR